MCYWFVRECLKYDATGDFGGIYSKGKNISEAFLMGIEKPISRVLMCRGA